MFAGIQHYFATCESHYLNACSIHMDIEWHVVKADSNLRKHGVNFEEAARYYLTLKHWRVRHVDAINEQRWVTIGLSDQSRLLTVVYTLRNDETLRIISARKSTRKEASYYA